MQLHKHTKDLGREDALYAIDPSMENKEKTLSRDRRGFLKAGGALTLGYVAVYSKPEIAFAGATSSLYPRTSFPEVMAKISAGYDNFVAVDIPLMEMVPLNPPAPSLVEEMAIDATDASALAQDAEQNYDNLSQDLKDLLDGSQEIQELQNQADAKQNKINQLKVKARNLMLEALANETPENVAAAKDAQSLVKTAFAELNDIVEALGNQIQNVIGAAGNLVVKVLETAAKGVGLVGKLFDWIGRIFE